jgi:pSer/pThr/pTyr-binding forkhead associated (FHA) protein
MNLLKLESRLRSLIEVDLISLLPGQKAEDLIIQKLTDALHSNLIERVDGSFIAPNVYTLLVHPDSAAHWKEPKLYEMLIEVLKTTGEDEGYHFDLPPTITISEDPSIKPGDFDLIASLRVEPMEETKDMKSDSESQFEENDNSAIPENAFLIVEGVKVYPLKQAVINIGRRLDNMVVVDDPRVSRNHAQLRAIKGRFVVFDLNSTGGTFVNGQRANQSVLYPGDVISLAGVTLIFGQDNPLPRPDLADTSPLGDASANRTTAVIHTRPPTPKKKK